jgi:hypothetical protein
MSKYTVPSPAELDAMYGDLTRDQAITVIATWNLSRRRKQNDKGDIENLEHFKLLDESFKQAIQKIFGNV